MDVGAGTGVITGPLLEIGARVIAVEMHPGRAAALRRRFGSDVIVVRADASDLRLPTKPFHVVANPPFGITTALLRRLLHRGSRLQSARLIVPAYAAHLWTSPHAPGRCRWEGTFSVTAGADVPRPAFCPPPPGRARVLVIERRPRR